MSGLSDLRGTPIQPLRGPRTLKRLECYTASCKAGRAAGEAAADGSAAARARTTGICMVARERTGHVICPDCGALFHIHDGVS